MTTAATPPTAPAAAPAGAEAVEGTITCPYCQDTVPSLIAIEPGLKMRLQQHAGLNPAPDRVCDGCFRMMKKMAMTGATLRAEAAAKDQNRLLLWKSRVGLVKSAKSHLAKKNYSDAAIAFEKYIRVLEIVHDKKSGELTPDIFKEDKRKQEITVIAAVYWDLMRVYDSHQQYASRQMKAAEKLSAFVRFTPIYPHIIRKAESLSRTAKNPEAYKRFLKLSNASRPRCFIATAAYDGVRTPTVDSLCAFRDQRLKSSALGRRAILVYYRYSPAIASFLDRHPRLKPSVRASLTWIAKQLGT